MKLITGILLLLSLTNAIASLCENKNLTTRLLDSSSSRDISSILLFADSNSESCHKKVSDSLYSFNKLNDKKIDKICLSYSPKEIDCAVKTNARVVSMSRHQLTFMDRLEICRYSTDKTVERSMIKIKTLSVEDAKKTINKVYSSYKEEIQSITGLGSEAKLDSNEKGSPFVDSINGKATIIVPSNFLKIGLNSDALALSVCHEIGHFIGGAPKTILKKSIFRTVYSVGSSEPQSDYFAALKCLKRVFQNEDSKKIIKNKFVPKDIVKLCAVNHTDENAIATCQRIVLAGMDLTMKLSIHLGKELPSLHYPSKEPATKKTLSSLGAYPTNQCRLDTIIAGAICNKADTSLNNDDPLVDSCSEEMGDLVGYRPRCWYKPSL